MPIHPEDLTFLPPHEPAPVSGLHGCLSQASLQPGGITFAAGSCMASLVLLEDQSFSNFIENVLHRLGFDGHQSSGTG